MQCASSSHHNVLMASTNCSFFSTLHNACRPARHWLVAFSCQKVTTQHGSMDPALIFRSCSVSHLNVVEWVWIFFIMQQWTPTLERLCFAKFCSPAREISPVVSELRGAVSNTFSFVFPHFATDRETFQVNVLSFRVVVFYVSSETILSFHGSLWLAHDLFQGHEVLRENYTYFSSSQAVGASS